MATTDPGLANAPLRDTKFAAEWLGITERALQQLRYLGTGPKFTRVGSRGVRYRMQDLIEYAESNLCTQTGDHG